MGIEMFLENGVSLTRFFQESFLNLHSLMRIINAATEPEGALLIFLIIYWGFNRDKGSRYLYLWGLTVAIFSIIQHILQFPAPFWFDSSIVFEETGSFAAPNLNIAIATLLVIPFTRKIRPDLVLIAYGSVALLAGLSQIYLGIASIIDISLGFILGISLIGLWNAWHKRFGRIFANRILGQRFWIAIAFPLILGSLYFVLINLVKNLGYTGLTQVDQNLYWRAWQTGFINTITGLSLLLGIGTGITFETARIGFRPTGELFTATINGAIGFAVLSGVIYFVRQFIPLSTIYETGSVLDLTLVALKCSLVGLVIAYFVPMIFTLLGTAPSEIPENPEISLNNFA